MRKRDRRGDENGRRKRSRKAAGVGEKNLLVFGGAGGAFCTCCHKVLFLTFLDVCIMMIHNSLQRRKYFLSKSAESGLFSNIFCTFAKMEYKETYHFYAFVIRELDCFWAQKQECYFCLSSRSLANGMCRGSQCAIIAHFLQPCCNRISYSRPSTAGRRHTLQRVWHRRVAAGSHGTVCEIGSRAAAACVSPAGCACCSTSHRTSATTAGGPITLPHTLTGNPASGKIGRSRTAAPAGTPTAGIRLSGTSVAEAPLAGRPRLGMPLCRDKRQPLRNGSRQLLRLTHQIRSHALY